MRQKTIEINYQSFKANEPSQILIYPYLLKEYRNRWFLIGANKRHVVITLALDRFVSVKEISGEKYLKNTFIDIETYFDDTIGVSKNPGMRPQLVVMKIDKANTPYILTKPLHASQKVLREDSDGTIIGITVTWNFELEKEILGFGEALFILSPKRLRNKINFRIRKMGENYEQNTMEYSAGEI
jgi:predicted DNA-binding transcriptional regulator YafY